MLTGIIVGITVTLALGLLNYRNAKKGTGLPGKVELALRTHGAMTLKEIATAVGKRSFFGRGEVAQALGGLSQAGKVRTIDAPPGTPQLQKVDVVKYELVNR
jgi:hypothetical protein